MPISYVGGTVTAYSTRQWVDVVNPGDLQVDDLILVYHLVGRGGSTDAPSVIPTGFVLSAGPYSAVDSSGFTVTTRVYSKFAVADDAGVTPVNAQWNFGQPDSSGNLQSVCLVYRGVDVSTPFDTVPTSHVQAINSGLGSQFTFNGLTTATAEAMLVAFAQDWGANTQNLTPPVGFTERTELLITYSADMVAPTIGATGDFTSPSNSDSNQPYSTYLLALRPLSVGAPSSGVGSGSTVYVGLANGTTTPKGYSSGSSSYLGTANGKTTPKGSSSGDSVYSGTAFGRRNSQGVSIGETFRVGAASGISGLVLWEDIDFDVVLLDSPWSAELLLDQNVYSCELL